MSLRRTAAVARKEMRHILRDARSLAMALLVPVLMLLLFGVALSLDVDQIPTLVFDADHTAASRELIEQFRGSRYFQILGYTASYQAIERDITEPLRVGFVLCQDGGISGDVLKSAEEAVLGCLVLKRPVHRWAFGRFASGGSAGGSIEPAVFLGDNGKLQKSVEESPMETNLVSTTMAALGWLLPGMLRPCR